MMDKDSEKKECEYCKESIAKTARKCKVCGEPCYFRGKALKFTPLMLNVLPLAFAIVSGIYAMTERRERQVVEKAHMEVSGELDISNKERLRATQRAVVAEKARVAISRELDMSKQVTREIAQKLPAAPTEEIRNGIIRDLRLPRGSADETLKQLEQKAKAEPENLRLQKNLYMFRALKNPD